MKQTTVYILLLLLTACQSKDKLDMALEYAGDNRAELEKVLEHYQGDEMKYRAARFLIENMVGHSGHDSTAVQQFQAVYDKYVAISEKYNWNVATEWQKEIDRLWSENRYKVLHVSSQKDIRVVRADWLIREIDRSFKAWQENAYTRNAPFEDFCRYILPYRYAEGICIDNSRDVFYQRHAHVFNDTTRSISIVIDSLHQQYSDQLYCDMAAVDMPIYDAKTFEYIKRGVCDTKAWYNCLQLSALGMAVAIDFVPAWANRSGAHTWNSLIINGETYPFEPFNDWERWKYKQVYNNESFDRYWGRFRAAKIYRRTFEYYLEGPLADPKVNREDIPPLFLNPFMRDVSNEYFKTVDVNISLSRPIKKNIKYAYLCIYGNQGWIPVQWGKIRKNGKVLFKDMGKDIVYLPMFYQNGNLLPAGPAFLLDSNGQQIILQPEKEVKPITVSTYTSFLLPDEILKLEAMLKNACLCGDNNPEFSHPDTLVCLPRNQEAWGNEITINNPSQYRYLRLDLPADSIGLCEIAFYSPASDEPIQPTKIISTNLHSTNLKEDIRQIIDGYSATGWRGKANQKGFICWELPKSCSIAKIKYYPYIAPHFIRGKELSLQYWDNAWITAGTQRWEKGTLTFNDVPQGTIYRVRTEGTNDRIFTYKNGMIQWY